MDVLITAGGTPLPGELLYEYTRGAPKVMLNIAGKPMVQWVLDAVSHSKLVDHIVVIGLPELGGITCPKPLTLLPNQADMLTNIITGIKQVSRLNPSAEHVLIVASDIPAITTDMVDWLIDIVEKSDADIFYNVVSQELMEKRYPKSKRTYTHLKDCSICGGDMNAVRVDMVENSSKLWVDLIASRKNPLKQASILGIDLLIKLVFRAVTLEEAAKIISRRLGIKGKLIQSAYPEIGMDVDKPHQLEIMREDLSRVGDILTLLNIIQKDEELSRSVRVLEGNKWIKPFAVVFAHSGDSWFWLAGLILVVIFGEKTWKIWAMILSGSILALAVFVLSLKFMIRRRRPEGEWGQIYRITDPHSFPSGHAARAFSLAILAIGLGPIWLAWMLVFWAPLVGLARVILGVHYLSDVVVGFIIGIIYGLIVILLKPVYLPYIIGILNLFQK